MPPISPPQTEEVPSLSTRVERRSCSGLSPAGIPSGQGCIQIGVVYLVYKLAGEAPRNREIRRAGVKSREEQQDEARGWVAALPFHLY